MGPHGPEVLSYELVRTVVRDPRFVPAVRPVVAAQGITSGPVWDRVCRSILGLQGRTHHRLRRLVSRAFTPRGAERLRRASSTSSPNSLTATPPRGTATWSPISPADTRSRSSARCWAFPARTGGCSRPGQMTSGRYSTGTSLTTSPPSCGVGELDAYIEEMIAQRRDNLADDLISDLIRAEEDGDRLSHDELLMLAATLLNAGTDTTRNQLAAAVHVLHRHPDQWALFAEHPELADSAVHELIRYFPIVFALARMATEDVQLRRRDHSGRDSRHCQHGCRQPRPGRLRRSRPPGHHPRAVAAQPVVRRRRALLPGRPPGPSRTRRGAAHHHAPHAQPAPGGPTLWKRLTGITGPTTLPLEFDPGH